MTIFQQRKSEIHTLNISRRFFADISQTSNDWLFFWLKYILITFYFWILLFNLNAAQHMICHAFSSGSCKNSSFFFSLICRSFCTEIVKLFVWITIFFATFEAVWYFQRYCFLLVFVDVVICDRMRFANDERKKKN